MILNSKYTTQVRAERYKLSGLRTFETLCRNSRTKLSQKRRWCISSFREWARVRIVTRRPDGKKRKGKKMRIHARLQRPRGYRLKGLNKREGLEMLARLINVNLIRRECRCIYGCRRQSSRLLSLSRARMQKIMRRLHTRIIFPIY